MDYSWELIYVCLLAAHVINAQLGIRHTPTEAGFGVGFVLAVAVAASWTTPHCECSKVESKPKPRSSCRPQGEEETADGNSARVGGGWGYYGHPWQTMQLL